MATRSSKSDLYYISASALSISENIDGDARRFMVYVAQGSIIKVYSNKPTIGNDTHFFDTGATGGYKQWTLNGYNTYIGDANYGKDLYLYVRISSEENSTADIIFSSVDEESYKMEGVKSSEESDIVYYYIKLGTATFNSETESYSLAWDSGWLDTDAYWQNNNPLKDMFEVVDEAIKPLRSFTHLNVIGAISAASASLTGALTAASATLSGALSAASATLSGTLSAASASITGTVSAAIGSFSSYITVASQKLSGLLTSSSTESASDEHAATGGYLNNAYLTKIRGLFVQKDVTTEEHMKGSLKMDGGLNVGGDATVSGTTTSDTFKSSNFKTGGLDGAGVAMWKDSTGGNVETDYMYVRKAAWFRQITIEDVKHVGGEMVLSAAACQIGRVEPGWGVNPDTGALIPPPGNDKTIPPTLYRCYFETEANGKKQYNEWAVNDQARCQVCNLTTGASENKCTKYYWRLVINVHSAEGNETEHYIDLSNTDYDGNTGNPTGTDVSFAQNWSAAPEADDNIVLLGSRNEDKSRTSAQVYSTVSKDAPSRKYYHNITSYSLEGCEVEGMGYDAESNHAVWKVGNTDQYISFDKDGLRMQLRELHIKTTSGASKDISTLADGQIEVYLLKEGESLPTWADKDKANHEHAVAVKSDGTCFRWTKNEETFSWQAVSDKHLIAAINKADDAKKLADDIVSDGKVLPSEKYAMQIYLETVEQEYADISKQLGFIVTCSYIGNTEKAQFNSAFSTYDSAEKVLVATLKTITNKDTWDDIITIDGDNLKTYNYNYATALKNVKALLSTLNGSFMDQTAKATKIGNKFFESDGKGGFVANQSELVTKKGFAGLITTEEVEWADGTKKTVGAQISAEISNGISSANISAQQVQLNGYTTVNGRMHVDLDGNLFAEQGTFGGMTRSKYRVIHSRNATKYGYYDRMDNSYCVDINKAGACFGIYEDFNQSDDNTKSGEYTFVCDYIAVILPYFTGISADNSWRDIISMYDARQYIGKEIVLFYRSNKELHIVGTGAKDNWTKYNYENSKFGANGAILVMKCVQTIVNGNESIIWQVEPHTLSAPPATGSKYIYSLDNYRIYPDLFATCVGKEQEINPIDNYKMFQEWQNMESIYIRVARDKESYNNYMAYNSAFEEIRAMLTERKLFQAQGSSDQSSCNLFDQMEYKMKFRDGDSGQKDYTYTDVVDAWNAYYTAYDNLTLK